MHCISDSCEDELQPLFVALARRVERAHRQNQLDHRLPVFSGLPSLHRATVAFSLSRRQHCRLRRAARAARAGASDATGKPVCRASALGKRAQSFAMFRGIRLSRESANGSRKRGAQLKGVQVTAAARLHLGFLDLTGDLGRRFGSIGLAIDAFETRVRASRSAELRSFGRGARAGRDVWRAASPKALASIPARSSSSRSAIPAHAGLGSGTQLALAIATAFRRFAAIAARRARAMRACSIAARARAWAWRLFERGGLAVDAGRGPNTEIPPVVAWVNFPRDWRVLLILDPRVEGAHGEAERRAFAGLPRFPAECGERNLPPHADANPSRRRRRGSRGVRRRRRQGSGNRRRSFRPGPGRRPLHQRRGRPGSPRA